MIPVPRSSRLSVRKLRSRLGVRVGSFALVFALLAVIPGAALAIGVGETAPDFLLEDVRTGDPISLADERGNVVVLVFFAWWCPPCQSWSPYIMEQLIAPLAERDNVTVIAVASRLGTTKSDVLTHMETHGWDFPVVLDNATDLVYVMYGDSQDTFLVLDGNAVVRYKSGYGQNSAATTFPGVIQTADDILAVPVEPATWGAIKRLFP